MNDLANKIRKHLEGDFISRCFPMLSRHGVTDQDVLVHSIGCSLWNTLGHELGYSAITECPAPSGGAADIRSDSVWFDPQTNVPVALIEFERYDGTDAGKTKLTSKLTNLVDAARRWNTDSLLLILSAWNSGLVSAPDLAALETQFTSGSLDRRGSKIHPPTGASLLLQRFILRAGDDQLLRFNQVMYRPAS
jgi:hypothetical protein